MLNNILDCTECVTVCPEKYRNPQRCPDGFNYVSALKVQKFGKTITERKIKCIDCNNLFPFSVGEQLYFLSKGLSEPKRCPICRKVRKDSIVKVKEI
jgi:epoxyqueuosine reductase QueG